MLTPKDLTELSRLLDEVLALPADQREAWVFALPPELGHLRAPLREMLAREAGLAADPQLRTLPRLAAWDGDDPASVSAGDRIGPYRLIEEIGRGGMGSVWRAERADGSFQREVALKLPRLSWGEGLARRMAQERDIGAMLEHPNIARLYDAGIDGRGWPYLALELVKGQAIDAWCEAKQPNLRERLALLLQIAKALSHAHARLVVHRDIKPSNVLVTADGQAHLLDFGIAKLLGEAGAGLTEDGARRLTPHYAAPEQLRGEAVTVATDVYSLGVLAFELLSGQSPYRVTRNSRAAWEEAVLNGEPERASQRCSDSATARALRGDLDAILAKALQREPALRYGSVDAMAEDLQRHLRGEPVLAQPDRRWTRLRRLLRRHRVAVVSSTAVLSVLLIGGGFAWQARLKTEQALERQRVLTGFADAMLRSNQAQLLMQPIRGKPTPTPVDYAGLIQQRFPDDPGLQAELLKSLARAQIDIGVPELAGELVKQQLAALGRAGADAAQLAAAQLQAAEAWLAASRWPEAKTAADEALRLAGAHRGLRAEALASLAWSDWRSGRSDTATQRLDELDALLPGLPDSATAPARLLALRAEIAHRGGHYAQAADGMLRAILLAVRAQGDGSTLVLGLRQLAATRLVERSQWDAAGVQIRATVDRLREQGGPASIEASVIEAEFALARYQRGTLTYRTANQAMATAETLLDAQPLRPTNLSRRLGHAQGMLALAHGVPEVGWLRLRVNTGQPWGGVMPADEQRLQQALAWNDMELATGQRYAEFVPWLAELRRRIGMTGHPDTVADQARAALTAGWAGEGDAGLALLAAPHPADHGGVLAWVRAQLLLDLGRVREAAAAIADRPPPTDMLLPPELLTAEAVAAQIDCVQGRAARGRERLLVEAEILSQDRSPAAPRPAWLRAQAGLCALATGDRVGARALAAQARAVFSAQPMVAGYFKTPLQKLEAALRQR